MLGAVRIRSAFGSPFSALSGSLPDITRHSQAGEIVSHAVRMQSLGSQRGHRGAGARAVLLQQVAHAESREPLPAVIAEDRVIGRRLAAAFGK